MAQVNAMTNMWIDRQRGMIFSSTDAAANDSDKTMTVPTGYVWEIQTVNITYVSDATVGNRQVKLVVKDSAGVEIGNFNADSVQAASVTEYYNFSPAAGIATEAPAGYHYVAFPPFTLGAGATIRAYDSAAIAAATDDMTVTLYGVAYLDH